MELFHIVQEVHPAPYSPLTIQKKVKTEIMFGNPSTSCQGVGICKVMSYGQHTVQKCPKVTAWISVTQEGRLRFSFLKSTMDKPLIRKHFRWLLFQVCEPYILSERIAHKLGLTDAMVRPGIYTVWESHRYLIVDF